MIEGAPKQFPRRRGPKVDACTCGCKLSIHTNGEVVGECYICECPNFEFWKSFEEDEYYKIPSLSRRLTEE
jgi:hypothetical protein